MPRSLVIGLLVLAAAVATLSIAQPAPAAGPPQIADTWVSDVGASAADVHAEVNPNESATNVRTEYITAVTYQANLGATPPRDGFFGAFRLPPSGAGTPVGSGSEATPYLQRVRGLKPSTVYLYRVVATNTATTLGPIRSFLTEPNAPVFALPDGRGWELVSPPDKNGGAIAGAGSIFGGAVLQAAAGGDAVTFSSSSSFGAPQGSPGASQYVSRRVAGGWATENVSPALLSGSYPSEPDSGVPYQLFSADLGTSLLSNGKRCRSIGSDCQVANPPLPGSGAPAGFRNYYLRSAGPNFRALLDAADLAVSGLGPDRFEVSFVAASPDLSQVVLSSCAALTAQAVEVAGPGGECDPAAQNLYRWSAAGLTLVNLLPSAAQGTPGAAIAAQAGALSADGSRVYWVDGASGNLYLREGAQTFQVDGAVGGGGAFQTASADGAVAFFTKAGHLYRYDAVTTGATDQTPAGEVLGVLGAAADGSRVYYVTSAGIFLRQGGSTAAVAAGAVAVSGYPPATGTARVSPDGTHLAFLSSAQLTGFDNNGVQEAYLYDARTGTLICASCNPSGERPQGPATIPGANPNGKAFSAYKPRALSADGSRLFFDSLDSFAPQDTNNDWDVYQWEAAGAGDCQSQGGCLNLISSGRSEEGASFVDASLDGSDAFFLTDGSLVPSDPGSVDLYDARVGGGFPVPPTPIPCLGDACQPLPGEPEDPTPGTLLPGRGNPPLSSPGQGKKKAGKKGKGKKAGKGKKKAGKGKKRAAAGKRVRR